MNETTSEEVTDVTPSTGEPSRAAGGATLGPAPAPPAAGGACLHCGEDDAAPGEDFCGAVCAGRHQQDLADELSDAEEYMRAGGPL
jgi:hypothetical protein